MISATTAPATHSRSATRRDVDVHRPNKSGSFSLRSATPEELATRAQRGSLACYGELVTRFEGRLYNFLLRRTGSASEAEELAQEALVRAWERIASYDRRWRFSTWLFTIASRMAVSRHRELTRGRSRAIAAMEARETYVAQGNEQHPGASTEMKDEFAHVWRLAEATLNAEQLTGLWLRYAEDMSISDIATVLRRTQVGVRVMLFRARQSVLAAVQEQRGGPA